MLPKFRAWVKDYTSGEWRMCHHVRWIDFDGNRICTESGMQPEEFVLMQCTGLKDKHGKEIYEGDVVMLMDSDPDGFGVCRGVVMFESARFIIKPLHTCSFEAVDVCVVDDVYAEVIGDIYQNPELLEAC